MCLQMPSLHHHPRERKESVFPEIQSQKAAGRKEGQATPREALEAGRLRPQGAGSAVAEKGETCGMAAGTALAGRLSPISRREKHCLLFSGISPVLSYLSISISAFSL